MTLPGYTVNIQLGTDFGGARRPLGRFGHTTLYAGYARLLVAEGAIEVECGADQCEMRKGLRKIAKRLAL